MAHQCASYTRRTMTCTRSFLFTVLQISSLLGSFYTHPFDSNKAPQDNNADVLVAPRPCCEYRSQRQSIPKIDKIRLNPNDERPAARFCERVGRYYDTLKLFSRQDDISLLNPFFYEGDCKIERRFVAGGRPVERGLSHVVALGRLNENEQFTFHCGGSIVSWRWVLTAAHCTHGSNGGVSIARIGSRRLSDTNGVFIRIQRTIRHPEYKPPALYADIALLELEKGVAFDESLRPACLHVRDNYLVPYVAVCGWGATEFEGDESDTLQEAYLRILNNVDCELKHNRSIAVPEGVTSSMICAGSFRGGRLQDTCQGDSGGPLQTSHPKWACLNEIIGITSFGSGCAIADTPGVYTRVSYYLKWIEDIVWPEVKASL